jgi:DNA modification methylase
MINLMHGDCLELMKTIPDKSIDMVLTDPPYGTTACKWDNVIPFEPMWIELKRITKDNAAIVLFGSEPFSSHLRLSNLKMFKYDWIWDTGNKITNFMNAKKQPMRNHENISVFYRKQPQYNRQMRDGAYTTRKTKIRQSDAYGDMSGLSEDFGRKVDALNPISIIRFNGALTNSRLHPTQKPVPLLEYLIKTYTLENETVLDFTMGSGSTGVASKNLNRNFIGIEKDDLYFEIATKRINELL